jgi:hypothetical protein
MSKQVVKPIVGPIVGQRVERTGLAYKGIEINVSIGTIGVIRKVVDSQGYIEVMLPNCDRFHSWDPRFYKIVNPFYCALCQTNPTLEDDYYCDDCRP